jgi:dihydropteroate synthase
MFEKQHQTRLPFGGRVVDLALPKVMGILNVTPDSFSDGGRFNRVDAALKHADAMTVAGATFIDVGGESTRPGAASITASEELDRVLPVVESIVRELDVVVSLDTSTPEVMSEGARLGAGLINDVRSLSRPGALNAAAASGLPVCLMHMVGEPATMQDDPSYPDIVVAVHEFLQARIASCVAAGISRDRLIIDPGFGFAKTLGHNLTLFNRMEELSSLELPMLVGVSRKSMIGHTLNRPVEQRLAGSLALAALAVSKGACILRVHDVAETVDVVRMIAAVKTAK